MRNIEPVLLVEDDDLDALMVKQAFADLKVKNTLVHSFDGKEAIGYLKKDGNKIPCLILLDLNMPRMNGLEFLGVTKSDAVLKKIPVVILTTSDSDHNRAFGMGAVGYIAKTDNYQSFVQAMRTINLYWTLSQMPDRG